MAYVFNPYSHELFHDDQVIIANTKSGIYMKTSKSYYLVLKDMVNNGEIQLLLNPAKSSQHIEVVHNLTNLFHELVNIQCILTEDQLSDVYKESVDVVYLALTNRCNLHCKHCSASADIRFTDALTTEKVKKVIDQIVVLRPQAINVTGGEPMMRIDIMHILVYLRSKFDGMVLLSTNGLFISEKNAEQLLEYVDKVSFSVDGYDEDTCSQIRGKGVFNRVIKSIKLLQSKGLQKIALSMTITNYTLDGGKEKFLSLCKELKVEPILRTMTPEGRAGENSDEIFPVKPFEGDLTSEDVACRLCSPGKRELFIGGDGNIYPCGGLMESVDFVLGNVFDNNIVTLLADSNLKTDYAQIERIRPWNFEPCADCDVHLFCHHCISNIYYLYQNQQLFDSVCQRKKKQLQKLIWNN
ncbi:radical SAM protein [Paenibacillus polymyxa]|uniref:radical SAM/SPASM domain-containing protein n=1 Tax=Paenibacillus polymyxa TaxID=1406 RepID=UPI0004D88895|nr:radical SAM protein [Paenibacillus polymyxa]KEO77116.1 radical SAM protein [Paenibacillus polymyxa]MCH6189035.1 radical SAM protein [Paenibacillus polymyxa]MDY8095769.1 radical SAM protein [Paenibacillus polymyxa]WRL57860.1 radical SAM protein [Paenibacillus polymyxa]